MQTIHVSQLSKAFTQWVDEQLIPRSSLVQRGVITFLLLQGKAKIDEMFLYLTPLADQDGNFKIDELHANLTKGLNAMGGVYTIPLLNYRFDQQDLDAVFEIIKRGV